MDAAPRSMARWMVRRPTWLSGWLQWRNACRRAGSICWLCLPLIAVTLWLLDRGPVIRFLEASAAHPIAIGGLVTLASAATIARRRSRVQSDRTRSWLAAVPYDVSLLGRVLAAPVAVLCLYTLALTAMVLTAHLPVFNAVSLLLIVLAGCLLGVPIGWLLPHGSSPAHPGSWYATMRGPRSQKLRPSLFALGYWGVAQTQVWNRPRIRARGALLILSVLPMGVSGAFALAATAACFMGFYLVTLLLAIVRVPFSAAWWLAPTGVSVARFAMSISYLALLRQAMICALALGAVYVVGGAPALRYGVQSVAAWIVLVSLLGFIAGALAHRRGVVADSLLHRWLR